MNLCVDATRKESLTAQLASQLERMIRTRALAVGARLPSIRQLAKSQKISRFTILEAYDLLVARGLIRARHGAGFFVVSHGARLAEILAHDDSRSPAERAAGAGPLHLSEGFIPMTWREGEALAQLVRQAMRIDPDCLTSYASIEGDPSLRAHISLRMGMLGIEAAPDRITTTTSASHALDLVARVLLQPGDLVLVEDPGYFNLIGMLQSQDVRLIGIPRRENGPDLSVLQTVLAQHRPKAFFLNSALHNPTGSNLSAQMAFRLLQLAHQHDFWIVEDDVYADFQSVPTPRVAGLDQMERVLYVGSFSKTISGALRIGWIAANEEMTLRLTQLKALTGLGGSRLVESIVAHALESGMYARHCDRLRRRVGQAFGTAVTLLQDNGWEVFPGAEGGYNIWARHPDVDHAASIREQARRQGLIIAPGEPFMVEPQACGWMRFNAVRLTEPAAMAFLRTGPGQIAHDRPPGQD